jgi:hypothetical protein
MDVSHWPGGKTGEENERQDLEEGERGRSGMGILSARKVRLSGTNSGATAGKSSKHAQNPFGVAIRG